MAFDTVHHKGTTSLVIISNCFFFVPVGTGFGENPIFVRISTEILYIMSVDTHISLVPMD